MNKPTQKVRAGQPMTADVFALHRVDTQYIADSHARVVSGDYEQRPMPIDVAEPDEDYEYQEFGKGWLVFALVCIAAFMAFGVYINWS